MATTSVYRTITSAGSLTTWTFSCWVKRASVTSTNKILICNRNTAGSKVSKVQFNFTIEAIQFYDNNASDAQIDNKTDASYRDVGAWYHIVQVWDSTNGTPADRARLWVNGVRVTDFSAEVTPASSQESPLLEANSPSIIAIGRDPVANDSYFDGEMSHVHLIDGTAYDASTFGETDATSGIWKIKTSPSVTYGTNGFFLKMEDRTNLDLDSGTNAFTMTTGGNLTATYDNPNNNFATLNALARNVSDTGSLANGNTSYTLSSYVYNCRSTLPMPAGKWYWEIKQGQIGTRVGVTTANSNNNADTDGSSFFWGDAGNGGIHILKSNNTANWVRTNNDTSQSLDTPTGNGIASATDDIIIMALDVDNQKLWVGVNGVWGNSGDPAGGTGEVMTMTNSSPDPYAAFIGFDATSSGDTAKFNFGNGYFGTTAVTSANADDAGIGAFEYDVPTGFYALCTKNLKLQGG